MKYKRRESAAMLFERQDTTKKPAIIVKRIMELIESGELKQGDKLPNEMGIVKQTEISRTSVREALSALELMGIIERVPGEGTFIASTSPFKEERSKDLLLKFLEDTENVNGSFEALESRMVLEPSVALMAARRAEPEDIAAMEAILEKMNQSIDSGDTEVFLDLDSEFHLAIAKATQNDVLFEMSKQLLQMADIHMWRTFKINLGLLRPTVDIHRKILGAIKKRDPKKAEFYAETHLMHYINEVVEKTN
jgi:GntR family transcriptional repressor for pyruvate dehydrogenase complex